LLNSPFFCLFTSLKMGGWITPSYREDQNGFYDTHSRHDRLHCGAFRAASRPLLYRAVCVTFRFACWMP
ncbi:MAG: hypothetical protein WBJ59_06925, partial [Dysgonamonadaceae bacterium]